MLVVAACGSRSGLDLPISERSGIPDPVTPRMDASTPFDAGDVPVPELDAGMQIEDAGPPGDAGLPPCRIPSPVDLLLVVDDSGSMWEEQTTLADQLPRLVSDLVNPPDENGDGEPDWRGVADLHLGVVTSGVGPLCVGGDDGVLRNRAAAGLMGCDGMFPEFLTYVASEDNVDQVSAEFACVAQAGTDGCGLEQPLEAALKALLPSNSGLPFFGSGPHGDLENAGFLRDDSMLAIVILTDEEDCSVSSDRFPPREPGDLPECMGEDDPLFPIERYVDAFRSLRTERPDLFTFAAIAGVPPELTEDPTEVDYDRLLGDSTMVYRLDRTSTFADIVPACEGRWGRAHPARRLVEVAREFGDQGAVASICQRSYRPIVEAIARHVGTRACEEFETD